MKKIVYIAALYLCASAANAEAQAIDQLRFPVSSKTETTLNFSKNAKFQYGLGVAFSYPVTPLLPLANKADFDTSSKTSFSTSAFLNYRVDANYTLASSLRYMSGHETGVLLSLEARKVNIFSRKHRLTTMLNVNWSNQTNPYQDLWLARDRRTAKNFELNNFHYKQTALGVGARWNWQIDTNWSLSTGINANIRLNNPEKNPLTAQRAPITVFSVASYRF